MAITVIQYSDMLNWSVGNVFEETLHYNSQYALVRLSELLTFDEERCQLESDVYYQQVTLKLNGNGLEKRRKGFKKGADIRTREQHFLRVGQLVFSKIDARNGAFALVSDDFDGAIVTKDFPTYLIDEQRVMPLYLLLLLLSEPFLQLVGRCSKGTTKRQRVDVDMLMNQQIPVPSLAEQDTILCQYQNVLGDLQEREGKALQKEHEKEQYITETLGLKEYTTQDITETPKLMFVKYEELANWNVSVAVKADRLESDKYPIYTLAELGDVVLLNKKGYNPRYDETSSIRILNQKCVRWDYIDLQYAKGVNSIWAEGISNDYSTREGDILINSTGEGTIGRSAVVNQSSKGMLYDSHIMLLRLNPQWLNPLYLSLFINSKQGQGQIEKLKSAKTTNQTELGVYNLAKLLIPIPPLAIQQIIVEEVKKTNEEIAHLKDVEPIRANAKMYFEQQVYEA